MIFRQKRWGFTNFFIPAEFFREAQESLQPTVSGRTVHVVERTYRATPP